MIAGTLRNKKTNRRLPGHSPKTCWDYFIEGLFSGNKKLTDKFLLVH